MSDLRRTEKIANFLAETGFPDADPVKVNAALTHPSYCFEDKSAEHYERFEFLGDAVIKLAVSGYLYRKFPDYAEGKMTTIRAIVVSDRFLVNFANKLKLPDLVRVSASFDREGGRYKQSTQACAFEGFLGALYDSEIPTSRIFKFLDDLFAPYIENIEDFLLKFNAKALLQEYTQSLTKTLPEYNISRQSGRQRPSQTGKQNELRFTAEVSYEGKILATGEGGTKKEAEVNAAAAACKKIGIAERL